MATPRKIPSRASLSAAAGVIAGALFVIVFGPGDWIAGADLATIAMVLPLFVGGCRRRADFEAIGLIFSQPGSAWRIRSYFQDGRR